MIRKFLTHISLRNNRILNVGNPINQLDGVNKDFLDESNVDFHQIFTYNFSDNTNSVPATGEFTSDASIDSATQLKVNNTDLLSFISEDSIVNTSNFSKNQIRIQEVDDNNAYVIFEIDSYTQQSGYYDLNGQVIKSSFNGGAPTLSEDCKIIFLNNYTFTGTSGTASLNEGFVPDDGILGTGSRSLLDDGTWGDTSNFGQNIGTSDLTTSDNVRTLTLAGDLSTDNFNINNNSGSIIFRARGDGNVGINTSSPSEKLHINGSIRIQDGTEGNNYILTSDTNGVASWTASSNIVSGGDGNGIYDGSGSLSSDTVVTMHGTQSTDTLIFEDSNNNDIFKIQGDGILNIQNTGNGSPSTPLALDSTGDLVDASSLFDTVLKGSTSGSETIELFIDGVNGSRINVATDSMFAFELSVTGYSSTGGTRFDKYTGVIKNVGGSTETVNVVSEIITNNITSNVTVLSDNTNNALIVEVSGQTLTPVNWKASVELIKNSY